MLSRSFFNKLLLLAFILIIGFQTSASAKKKFSWSLSDLLKAEEEGYQSDSDLIQNYSIGEGSSNKDRQALQDKLERMEALLEKMDAGESITADKKLSEEEFEAKRKAEEKARKDAEKKAKKEAKERAKKEKELKKQREKEEKAQRKAEEKRRKEAEKKAKEEAELKKKQEAELKAKEAALLKEKQEEEKKAMEAKQLQEKHAAEQRVKEAALLKEKQEEEKRAREAKQLQEKHVAEQRTKEAAPQKIEQELEPPTTEDQDLEKLRNEIKLLSQEVTELAHLDTAFESPDDAPTTDASDEKLFIPSLEELEKIANRKIEEESSSQPEPSDLGSDIAKNESVQEVTAKPTDESEEETDRAEIPSLEDLRRLTEGIQTLEPDDVPAEEEDRGAISDFILDVKPELDPRAKHGGHYVTNDFFHYELVTHSDGYSRLYLYDLKGKPMNASKMLARYTVKNQSSIPLEGNFIASKEGGYYWKKFHPFVSNTLKILIEIKKSSEWIPIEMNIPLEKGEH